MKQKLAIARALLHEPAVVFLDEPTAALDPEAAYVVREAIEGLRSAGRTIVLATHNLDEADRLCDEVAFIRGGLLRIDTPARLRGSLAGGRVEIRLAGAREAETERRPARDRPRRPRRGRCRVRWRSARRRGGGARRRHARACPRPGRGGGGDRRGPARRHLARIGLLRGDGRPARRRRAARRSVRPGGAT